MNKMLVSIVTVTLMAGTVFFVFFMGVRTVTIRPSLSPEFVVKTGPEKTVEVDKNRLPHRVPVELYMDEAGVVLENSDKYFAGGELWGVRVYETETNTSTLYIRYLKSLESLNWGPVKEFQISHDGGFLLTTSRAHETLTILIRRSNDGKKSKVEVDLTIL